MVFKNFLLISIYTLIFIGNGYSQKKNNVIFKLSQKEVELKGRTLQTLILQVENHTDSTIAGVLNIKHDAHLELISRAKQSLVLQAGQTLFIPVKFIEGFKTPATTLENLTVSFSDGKMLNLSATCAIKMVVIKNVKLNTLVSSLILGLKGDSLQIPLRVSNAGNVTQRVNIVCQLPPELQNNGFHSPIQLNIPPYTDTLITISKIITRELFRMDNININIFGIYENGDVFGQSFVQVQNLKNKRTYQSALPQQVYQGSFKNSLTLSSQNLGSNFSSYQLYGGTGVETPYGLFGFNTDATFWKNSDKPYLRETYLSYENAQMGVLAGVISRNMETNANGSGATAFFLDTTTNNQYEIGFIEQQWNNGGHTSWAKFNHSHKDFRITTTALYEAEPYMQTNNAIIANDLTVTKFKDFNFSAEINLSQSANQHQVREKKLAYLASINTGIKLGAFYISSNNTMSSPYYAGIRRGYKSFSERLNFTAEKFNLWANYSYNETKPEYLNSLNYTNTYQATRAEIGASFALKKFYISLSPLYISEQNSYSYLQQMMQKGEITAYRMATQLNYSNAAQQLFMFLTVENGVGKEKSAQKYQNQFKANANLTWSILNIYGTFQRGNFYVSDVMNSSLRQDQENKILNLNTTLRKDFYRKKATLEAGVSYSMNSFSGKSLLFTGRSTYQVNRKTHIFAALYRTDYQYMNYSYNNLQLGITQKLPTTTAGSKNKSLAVLIYHDHNKNNIFDEGDEPAKGQLVYVDKIAFLSNNQGKITYKNVAPGHYLVKTPLKGNWYAADQPIMLNKENIALEIPMYKTGVLQGNINYVLKTYSPELNNTHEIYTIFARNKAGKIEKTKTDEAGRFTFYLPVDQYTISIEALPEQIVCTNNNTSLAIKEEGSQKITLQLHVKERSIKTQKFISKSAKEKK